MAATLSNCQAARITQLSQQLNAEKAENTLLRRALAVAEAVAEADAQVEERQRFAGCFKRFKAEMEGGRVSNAYDVTIHHHDDHHHLLLRLLYVEKEEAEAEEVQQLRSAAWPFKALLAL